MLEEDFAGQPISECNLTRWKNGGFVDWNARQEARAVIEEWQSEGSESGEMASAKMAESLTRALTAHYAVALQGSNANTSEEPSKRVERLGRSLKDMTRLRRYELARERLSEHVRIGEEWVALERERLELERAKLNPKQPGSETKPVGLSHEEKAKIVKQMLRDL